MKNKKVILGIFSLLLISLFATGCKQEIEIKDGSKVAVKLDGTKITATEYYEKIKETNVSILVDMIDKALFEKKYPTTEDEDKEVKNQITQLKKNYSDENTFKQVLTQYFGVETEEELEEILRLEYKRNKAVEDYIAKNLSDNEIEKYYKDEISGEVKASHILIIPSVSDDADEDEIAEAEAQALKTAKTVIKKLNDGEDFAKLAKKYSNEEATATKGGDLGYFELDEMVDEFSNAVKELKVKEYTKEPVKSQFGYHIILKTAEKDKPELKDVKEEIKEKITKQKLSSDVTLYYQTLIDIRKENNIKWNDTVIEKKYNELMDQLLEAAKQQAQQQ
jgi:foldase protein PrsA